jgi:hypothetical protein
VHPVIVLVVVIAATGDLIEDFSQSFLPRKAPASRSGRETGASGGTPRPGYGGATQAGSSCPGVNGILHACRC